MKNKIVKFILLAFISSNAEFLSQQKIQDTGKTWSVYSKGFVQSDVMLTIHDMAVKEGFVSSSVVIPENTSSDTNFSVKQSQLGVGIKDSASQFFAYLEIDFLGKNGNTAPRFRQGFFQWKNWTIGQTWSNFSDVSIFPEILDFMGANGLLTARRVQVRYCIPLSSLKTLSFSIEDPNDTSIRLPNDSLQWRKKNLVPSFTVLFRYGNEKSYVKLGGIMTPISYQVKEDSHVAYKTRSLIGFGGLFSSRLQINSYDSIGLQLSAGKGISSNNAVLNGEQYDAISNPERNNKLEALRLFNLVCIYEHWWSRKWSSVVLYSYSKVGKADYIPARLLQSFQNASANIIFHPYRNVRLGIECNYGRAVNFSFASANALRLQLSTTFKF